MILNQYEHFHYHCDILVVGGGISGMYAAELAAKANLKVLLLEQKAKAGGEITNNAIVKIKSNYTKTNK